MMICGTYDDARHTRSAAVAVPLLTPMAVSRPIMIASTVPKPPGVRGIIMPIWATAKAPKAARIGVDSVGPPPTQRRVEDQKLCERHRKFGHGDAAPPLAHQIRDTAAEAENGRNKVRPIPLLDLLHDEPNGPVSKPADRCCGLLTSDDQPEDHHHDDEDD